MTIMSDGCMDFDEPGREIEPRVRLISFRDVRRLNQHSDQPVR